MAKKLRKFVKNYYELVVYCFFGVVTTIVNIATYYLFHNVLGLANLPSNLIAWVASVSVAYVTNKLWVFNSKSWKPSVVITEIVSFVGGRILTGATDSLLMWLTVDVWQMNDVLWKVIVNIITIILNFFVSKFVFRKKKSAKAPATTTTKSSKPSKTPKSSKSSGR